MSILIRYLHELSEEPGEPDLALGEITLGSFIEQFEMNLSTWSVERYQRQWYEGIQKILDGASKSCLMTSFWREDDAFGGEWWPMYRVQDYVIVQDQFIRPDIFSQKFDNFDPDDPYPSIPDRESVNEDGQKISEWSVPFNQIAPLSPLK